VADTLVGFETPCEPVGSFRPRAGVKAGDTFRLQLTEATEPSDC
jgi:hypothetical protein